MSQVIAGKYRLLRQIGAGGMGEVFEAVNAETHKRVAIKRIRSMAGAQPDALDRLAQEARGSALVRHPNVVDVYDLVREGDSAVLIMEFLEGEPLSAAIERGDVPTHRMVGYVLGAMRGVAAAHREGVVHRDVKPDNIFLAREGDTPVPVPKVLDFGVCKLRANTPSSLSLTRSGHMMGTPVYMPLEQLEGRTDVDERADVYAFGVTLYQALTQQLPVQATSLTELVVKLSLGQVVLPSAIRPELPQPLERLILWALEARREQRLPSLQAFVDELEPFASEREYSCADARASRFCSTPVGPALAPQDQARSQVKGASADSPPRRTRRALLGGVLAVCVLAALLGLLGWRTQQAQGRAGAAPLAPPRRRPRPRRRVCRQPNPRELRREPLSLQPHSSGRACPRRRLWREVPVHTRRGLASSALSRASASMGRRASRSRAARQRRSEARASSPLPRRRICAAD
jgi:serine/threonine-protein kinase